MKWHQSVYRDDDDAIIRPFPQVKRLLSDPVCLPHIGQLLLTFDPVLVEKVATLLCEVMRDNPNIPTLYLTGVFYFILMYTGSNVLPVARFLQLTHTKQALKGSDISEMFNLIVYISLCCLTVYWMFSARAFSYTTLSSHPLWIRISFNIILICPKPLKFCEKRTRRVIPEPTIRHSPEQLDHFTSAQSALILSSRLVFTLQVATLQQISPVKLCMHFMLYMRV